MRRFRLIALFSALQVLTVPLLMRAGDIREADYPVHYEVLSVDQSAKWVIQKVCSLEIRDHANKNVTFRVSRKSLGGSCSVLDQGRIYAGRENKEKNEIELVIPVGEDRARLERWHIDATINTNS